MAAQISVGGKRHIQAERDEKSKEEERGEEEEMGQEDEQSEEEGKNMERARHRACRACVCAQRARGGHPRTPLVLP